MKGRIDTVEDNFWTEHLPFFTAQFPSLYREPQQVHGRFHASDERYFDGSHEIIPLQAPKGTRTYVRSKDTYDAWGVGHWRAKPL